MRPWIKKFDLSHKSTKLQYPTLINSHKIKAQLLFMGVSNEKNINCAIIIKRISMRFC